MVEKIDYCGAELWLQPEDQIRVQTVSRLARTGDLSSTFSDVTFLSTVSLVSDISTIWGSFLLLSLAPSKKTVEAMIEELEEVERYSYFLKLRYHQAFWHADTDSNKGKVYRQVMKTFATLCERTSDLIEVDRTFLATLKGPVDCKKHGELEYRVSEVLKAHQIFCKNVKEVGPAITECSKNIRRELFLDSVLLYQIAERVKIIANKSLFPILEIKKHGIPSEEEESCMSERSRSFWHSGDLIYKHLKSHVKHLERDRRVHCIQSFVQLHQDLSLLGSTEDRVVFFKDWVLSMLLKPLCPRSTRVTAARAIGRKALRKNLGEGLEELYTRSTSAEEFMGRARLFVKGAFIQIRQRVGSVASCKKLVSKDQFLQQFIFVTFIQMFLESPFFHDLVLRPERFLPLDDQGDEGGGDGGGGGGGGC